MWPAWFTDLYPYSIVLSSNLTGTMRKWSGLIRELMPRYSEVDPSATIPWSFSRWSGLFRKVYPRKYVKSHSQGVRIMMMSSMRSLLLSKFFQHFLTRIRVINHTYFTHFLLPASFHANLSQLSQLHETNSLNSAKCFPRVHKIKVVRGMIPSYFLNETDPKPSTPLRKEPFVDLPNARKFHPPDS